MNHSIPLLAAALSTFALAACVEDPDADPTSTATSDLDTQSGHGREEPPMLGAHQARGAKPGGGGSSPQLAYKGGTIMTNVVVQPIYWGTSWSSASFTGDKITGLTSEYNAFANSAYARTNIEYTGSNGTVTGTSISVAPNLIDTSAATRGAPQTSAILAEVCKMISNPSPDGYYPVYTDTPRGHAGYCAWHSWGQCGGVNVQFGFFFSLDADNGCDVSGSATRSVGLASLANVTGHEFSEMVTDPRGTGWLDASGSENADKCAWVFDEPARLADGSTWTIQGNWSNAAYTAGTGLPNSSGQNGCLYNH
jgi:hypothetical protein